MAVTLKVKATLKNEENSLDLQFDTSKKNYDIKINNTSLISAFNESIVDTIDWLDGPKNILKLLTTHKSVKIEDCIAILKPAKDIVINEKNEEYLLYNKYRRNIMPYNELIEFNEDIQKQYNIITSKTETIFDSYKFIADIIRYYNTNVTDMLAVLDITTEDSKMNINLTYIGDKKFKVTVKQSLYRNNTWYENLYGISTKYFKQPDVDIERFALPYSIYLPKNIDNWSTFEIPLYIYRLKADYAITQDSPYIISSTCVTNIPDKYELLCMQTIPHETYLKEFEQKQIDPLKFDDATMLIYSIITELRDKQ